MKCPGCGADVEEGADLCLECGEPMGDSPAARMARAEASKPAGNVIVPPAGTFGGPRPAPTTAPAAPAPTKPAATSPPAPAAKPAGRKWRDEEPEPKRCPGCGTKTHAVRCPGCGTKLRSDDE